MNFEKKTYTLTVKNLRFDDFGNYSCQAANFLGRDYKTIHLSGIEIT